ncbi:MAG: helix-turn-helix domain-containing protein [Gammaproteobacteria bacterium]|nr:helix-turn-helix domain-containing protein [Gammaproteobacteria bacterium]
MSKREEIKQLVISIKDDRKLSYQELAELVGVSRQTIYKWSRGTVGEVHQNHLKKLRDLVRP